MSVSKKQICVQNIALQYKPTLGSKPSAAMYYHVLKFPLHKTKLIHKGGLYTLDKNTQNMVYWKKENT